MTKAFKVYPSHRTGSAPPLDDPQRSKSPRASPGGPQRGSGGRGHQEEPGIDAPVPHAVHKYGHWRWQRETVRGSVTKSEYRSAGLESCCLAAVHFPVLGVPAGAIGFSMAYENLPLHMAITVQELPESKPDPYYFILHISIDNSHSGAVGIPATTEHTTPAAQ
ncbi:hypothetical protein B9Z19DRAFT_1129872 [Tuber borchii]|uniref:Uncharacterized protein n=1 Tax=Tuber borchii TaxID=42251 RepID=A0A2T6ZLI4_TUBBO|nr:hypothetical protein B9Z19DRAFT_1129872 [Tuber borchii]